MRNSHANYYYPRIHTSKVHLSLRIIAQGNTVAALEGTGSFPSAEPTQSEEKIFPRRAHDKQHLNRFTFSLRRVSGVCSGGTSSALGLLEDPGSFP